VIRSGEMMEGLTETGAILMAVSGPNVNGCLIWPAAGQTGIGVTVAKIGGTGRGSRTRVVKKTKPRTAGRVPWDGETMTGSRT
jgi:hypothetical protein